MDNENDDNMDYPCNTCNYDCDIWEARYCCDLCTWENNGVHGDCENCDPMNI